jgi:uncharacterized protein (TIGR00369 family)
MSDTRSRTFTWEDPMIGANAAKGLSGLEYLQKMINGEIPSSPIGRLMDMSGAEISEGRVVFSAMPQEFHYNPIGVVHGGFFATLLDSALGCSIHSALPVGVGYTTLELHINFIRAITQTTGMVQAIGEVIHVGRTVATSQARLVDANGKLYAHGTTTCMIFRPD